jgi:hypothetical protein
VKALIALAALAACATAGPEGAEGVATAGIGGAARLGDVVVRPLAVLEDSRCPRDVTCVWAGRLRLSAAISTVPGTSELVLGQRFALPGGGAIILVSAAPERWQVPPPGTDPRAAPRFGFRREADRPPP